jgi:hypothetical protein
MPTPKPAAKATKAKPAKKPTYNENGRYASRRSLKNKGHTAVHDDSVKARCIAEGLAGSQAWQILAGLKRDGIDPLPESRTINNWIKMAEIGMTQRMQAANKMALNASLFDEIYIFMVEATRAATALARLAQDETYTRTQDAAKNAVLAGVLNDKVPALGEFATVYGERLLAVRAAIRSDVVITDPHRAIALAEPIGQLQETAL